MKHFYDHLILIEEVIGQIDLHDLTAEERDELVQLVDQTLHHHALDTILTHLPKDKHEHFLSRYHHDPADHQLLNWLKSEIKADIEAAIKVQAAKIKKEILAEIKKARK